MMMLHGKLLLGPAMHDIVVPPAVLADTTTRCLLNAVLARLPMTIEDCLTENGSVTLIVNTDSARACKLLGRTMASHYTDSRNMRVLTTYCVMHLVVIAANQVLKPLKIVNSLFCLANLLHDSKVMSRVLEAVGDYVERHLVQTVRPRDPRHREHARQVLDLLHWDDALLSADDSELRRESSRKKAWQAELDKVLDLLPYDWSSQQLLHYCPIGCCDSRATAVRKITEKFNLLFSAAPPIPAPNKWLKMYPPI